MALSNFVRNVIEEYKQSTTNPTSEGFLKFINRFDYIIGGVYLYEYKDEICELIYKEVSNMKDIFKVKIEKLTGENHIETGKLSEEIASSNLSNTDKIELLESIMDKKIEAENKSGSIMNLKQLAEKLNIEGEFDYEN